MRINLNNDWSAVGLHGQPYPGPISQVVLEHRRSGEMLEHVRFDTGKLLFLDESEILGDIPPGRLLRLASAIDQKELEELRPNMVAES
jgi:hypothetical protein